MFNVLKAKENVVGVGDTNHWHSDSYFKEVDWDLWNKEAKQNISV
jgi:hypothetical protein